MKRNSKHTSGNLLNPLGAQNNQNKDISVASQMIQNVLTKLNYICNAALAQRKSESQFAFLTSQSDCSSSPIWILSLIAKSTCSRLWTPLSLHADGRELNPLSPNSAQNQFSPNNIHRLSWAKSMRVNKMITKRKIFDLLPNSLSLFFKEMYGDQFGEFVWGYWDLKG